MSYAIIILKIETIYSTGVTEIIAAENPNLHKNCTANKRCIVKRLNENPNR